MQKRATLIVVFGTAEETNLEWLQHHEGKLPEFLDVICVENYYAPCFRTAAYLQDMCRFYNWRALTNLKDMLIHPPRLHGSALDLALNFVTTPYLFTIDSDCFVQNPSVFEEMLDVAEKERAAAVGCTLPTITIPYVLPFFACYRYDVAAKHGFGARWVDPQLVEPFWQADKENLDAWVEERRKGYLDVGCYLTLMAQLEGEKVIMDFPVENYVVHRWSGTPFIVYSLDDAGKIAPFVRFTFPSGDAVVLR